MPKSVLLKTASGRYTRAGRSVNKQMARTARKAAKSALNARSEVKYIDRKNTASSATDVGAIAPINIPGQGDGQSQRNGNSIYMRSIQGRWTATAADGTNIVRVLVFQYYDDTLLGSGDVDKVLDTTGGVGAVHAPYNHANTRSGKLKILYDKTVSLVDSTEKQLSNPHKFMITKLKKRRCVWEDGTATIPENNGLYWMNLSDSTAVSHPLVNYHARLRYNDM